MAYPPEIKEYAKTLYLTVNRETDQRRYSYGEIVKKIRQEFDDVKKINKQTIINWANTKDKVTKKSWVDLWQRGVRHGITNAVLENAEAFDEDEKFDIQIDKIKGLRAGNAIKLAEKIKKKLDNNEDLTREEIAAWRTSEFTFNNLNLESHPEVSTNTNFDREPQKQILKEEGYDES